MIAFKRPQISAARQSWAKRAFEAAAVSVTPMGRLHGGGPRPRSASARSSSDALPQRAVMKPRRPFDGLNLPFRCSLEGLAPSEGNNVHLKHVRRYECGGVGEDWRANISVLVFNPFSLCLQGCVMITSSLALVFKLQLKICIMCWNKPNPQSSTLQPVRPEFCFQTAQETLRRPISDEF